MTNIYDELKIIKNPFPVAATGIDVQSDLYMPEQWLNQINDFYRVLYSGKGVKAFPVIGEYGSGKTVLIKGYLKEFFGTKHIMAFYFENPGVQFYDLANSVLRDIGRYEFAKGLWEICKEYIDQDGQTVLYPLTFNQILKKFKNKQDRDSYTLKFQEIIKNNLKITVDDEIAFKFGSIITETANKPYFEYRDFIAGNKNTLVAEKMESNYFLALIRAIIQIYNIDGVAFLIDEFEDIAINEKITKQKGYGYLATLRHLLDLSQEENVWIIMAMTPEAAETTRNMNPALWDRFTHGERTKLELNPLTPLEAKEMISWWLNRVRGNDFKDYSNSLIPFDENYIEYLSKDSKLMLPRKLMKISFLTLSNAIERNQNSITSDLYEEIVDKYFSTD
ncbi:hypothetical protein DSECCO2_86040 [anaerobic digester metagenome]